MRIWHFPTKGKHIILLLAAFTQQIDFISLIISEQVSIKVVQVSNYHLLIKCSASLS